MIFLPVYISSHLYQTFNDVSFIFDRVRLSKYSIVNLEVFPFLMHFEDLLATDRLLWHDFPKMNAAS